ncbi:MAG: cytochrome c [Candidatus Bilamarchaeaceae archaeon]
MIVIPRIYFYRWLVLLVICQSCLCLVGCNNVPDFPPNISFPSRSDRLVIQLPLLSPPGPDVPGKMDDGIARVDLLGGRTLDPTLVNIQLRQALETYLKNVFGTPAAPMMSNHSVALRLGLTQKELTIGSKLYRKHCVQCHNISGDARGPAGQYVIPFPRDFRQGQFKFISAIQYGKPRRIDIIRTLTHGLSGTQMPSFSLLSNFDRDYLSRYVTYLSIRGQVEFDTLLAIGNGIIFDPTEVVSYADDRLRAILLDWENAEAKTSSVYDHQQPDDGPPGSHQHFEAVKRGHALFILPSDNSCISCHIDYGRNSKLKFDIWGTVARPANLLEPVLKGGNRPEDVYCRIRYGIAPVGMPAHPHLSDRQIWDLVRFVLAVPYPAHLPEDVRSAVYHVP